MVNFKLGVRVAAITTALLTMASPGVAQDFEGLITMQFSGLAANGVPQDVEFFTRGSRGVRVNAAGPMGAMSMISMPAEKKIYIVIDAQSIYMELPSSLDGLPVGMTMVEPKITRTGKRETIAGTACEHLRIEIGTEVTDVCMAQGLGPFLNILNAVRLGGKGAPAWQRGLAADGGFPLKVTGADGKVALEVRKIEKRKLSSALFVIPSNYTKVDMPGRR